jgi:N-acetylglutamate synthase-like GNAT family acetyltransferase
MKTTPKEYWIDEFKCNSAITKVVWKNRFTNQPDGWVAVSKTTNNFTKFIKEVKGKIPYTKSKKINNWLVDQLIQYAHQNNEYKTYKIYNEVEEFHIIESNDWHLHLYPYHDGVMIYTINVNEDKRGNGIGTKLLNKLYDLSENLSIPLYLIPYPDYEFLDKVDKEKELVDRLKNYYSRLEFGPVSEGSLVWSNFE